MEKFNNERVRICTKLSQSAFKSPEAITMLICIITDEVSLSDLNRIEMRYFQEIKEVHKRANIKN